MISWKKNEEVCTKAALDIPNPADIIKKGQTLASNKVSFLISFSWKIIGGVFCKETKIITMKAPIAKKKNGAV